MKRGFTLIEIMITMVVIGIMVTYANNSGFFFKRKTNLKAVATRTLNTIKLARSLALISKQSVCIKPDVTETITFCSTEPSISASNTRAKAVLSKLKSIMNQRFKLRNANLISNTAENKITFNSQGMREAGSASYLKFSATDQENQSVGNYLIQISISGSTRFCQVSSGATTCN